MVYESSVELIKLDDGEDGQQGKTGYIWVKYSENPDGSNMTDDSSNAVYMGIAYNKESQTESPNPADYTWIKILGEDGIGISSIQNKYAVNSSPTTPPTTWYDTLQTMTSTNKYLWNYEIITKTDGSSQESIKRVIGVYGDTGEDGVGIESITEYFLATSASSGVTTSTSGWTTSIQTITPTKKYLWNYEVVHYSNDTDYTSTPVIIGAYGEQGIPGEPGEDGVSTYFYIRYSENSNGNNMTATPNENSKYMGVCSTTATTAPTTASEYTWSLIKGADGQDGSPGQKGDDGRTSYLHIKYSNDGTTFTSNNGETIGSYIGTYVDFTEADSTNFGDYNWKKFVGEDGQDGADAKLAIINTSSQIFKAESGSNTYSPNSIVLTPTFQNCTYVRWQYSTNGTSWTNVTSGNNGLTIGTVNNVQNCLTISNSSTLFTNAVTSLVFKLVTNNSEVYDTMTITRLKDGQDGVSLEGIEEYFLASHLSTGITTSTSGWSTTVPTITSTNKYLWNYEKINYSSGDSVSTTPRIIGVYGETGQDGVGIENITNYYLATADGKNITTSSQGWTATPQTITNEKKYLWNYSEISYSDESTYQSNPVIIGTYGDAGIDSVNVILSNESHSFVATSNGNAVASSITNSVSGYKGTTKVATTIGTITGTPTGMSVNINNNNSTNTTLSISVTTSMATRSGVINIPVTVNGVTITKQFSYSLSLAGANGQDGDDGADAYTVFLSNQNHSFNCDASGNISATITTTTTVIAYKGTSTVTPTIGTLPTVAGLTLSKSGAVITIKANTGTSLATNGSFTIPVTVDGLQFSLVFSYSKLLDNGSLADDIEQMQEDILANQTEITNVKSIADANAVEILNKVSTDTFNNQVSIIQNDLEKANNGLDNWLIEIYPRNLFKTEDQSKCTIDVFSSNSDVLPSQTLLVSDDSLKSNANYGDNYIGYALTFVYFDSAYTLSTNWTHNKGASLYLNGGLINSSANSATSQNISIQFKAGWNCLEVVINETTGNDGFVFGTVISNLTQCKLMNCYYGSVTGRQSQVINKLVELKIDADSIESRVQETEETITTQDGKISTLTNQYSSLVQDLTGFKTTVSNTYVKNEDFEDTTSSLQESIQTVATQTSEKFDWLIQSGDSETNFTLTDRTAELITQYINLHGSVTFSGISTEAKQEITNNINSAVDEVKESAAYNIQVQYALGTSNTTAPNSGWSTTAPAWEEGKYMWQRTVTTYGDGSSQMSNATCISGANGKGIKSTSVTYQVSTNGTTAPSGNWSSNIPTVSAGQYLWTRTIITYTDDSTSTSYSVGRSGTNGTNGTSVSISSTSVKYQASSSGTTTPTGNWSTSIPSVSAGQYLWTKTVVTYSNGTSTTSYSVSRNGTNGQDGQDGTSVSVSSTKIEYQSGTSGTTQPNGTWSTSIPTVSAGNYLWTRVTTTYSDGKSAVSYSVARQGSNGTNGTSPTVSSTKVEYQQSTSGTTTPTGSWSTTPPTATAGQYMWTRTTVTYSDSKTAVSYSVSRNGANGAKGDQGDTGVSVKSVTPLYYCSNSTSVPAKPTSAVTTNSATAYNTWNKACATWTTTYRYYYVCSEILFDDNTRVWSDVVADNGLTTANGNANTAKNTADNVNTTLNANKGNWDLSYALVNYWTDGAVSDTTLINGGYIKTNTITADKIAIGDFSNYVDDPTFEMDIYDNSGSFSIDSSVYHTGSKSLKMAAGATNYTRFILNNYKNFPVAAGDYLYIEWWGYRNNANQTARINIALRNVLGDGIVLDLQNEGETFMPATAINNTWVKYSYVAYVTNDGFAEISFKLGSSSALTGNWYIDNVIVRRMSTGELIVDGAISADKLATDAIKSRNYSYTSGTYSTAGTFLDLANGVLRSKNFAIDASGNAFLRGEITAKDGDIYLGDDGFKLFDKLVFDTADDSLVINASEVNISGDPIATKKYSDRENLLIGSGGYEKDSVVLWEGTGWEFTPDTDMLKIQLDTDTTETELDDWAMIQIYKGLKTSTTYTLSVGLRSNMSTFSIYCATGGEGDEDVTSSKLYTFTNVTTAWKEFKFTWTTSSNEWLYMYFLRSEFTDDGYIDLRYMMLEEGTEATDWIPCKYDSEAVANYFRDDLNDKTDSLGDSIDSLTEKTDHTDSQIEEIIADDGIINQVVNASKEELSTRIDENETNISAARQELYDYQDVISRYMTFSSLGLILGMEGSAFTSRLTETELGFYNDANKLSWFSGNQMHIKEAVIEDTMTIGNLVFKKRNNGNISLVWRDS